MLLTVISLRTISLLALFLGASYSELLKTDFYVRTEYNQTCHTEVQTCHTIAEYLYSNQHLFVSNTTLHFLPGQHTVNGSGTDSSTVVIANLTDFTLEGWDVPTGEPPVVTVQCFHPVNFHFTNITRLCIQNIKFVQCFSTEPTFILGSQRVPYDTYIVSGLLELECLYDVLLHNVYIFDSIGFGIVGLNLLGNTTVRNCHFYNNSGNATHGGNALLWFDHNINHYNNTIEVINSEFAFGSNPEGSGGLGIVSQFFEDSISVSIYILQCYFNSNVGKKFGGGIFIDLKENTKVYFSDSIFSGNLATLDYGGAIHILGSWIYRETFVNFINCSFSENMAVQGGGAIFIAFTAWSASQCEFQNSTTNSDGGHIFSVDHHLSLSNCRFENGVAKGRGGALFQYNSISSFNLYVRNCTFAHNTAKEGGGVAVIIDSCYWKAVNTIENCNFTENKAIYGGGIYISTNFIKPCLTVLMPQCYFLKNFATSGGALCVFHRVYHNAGKIIFDIQDAKFIGNIAKSEGSAINITGCTYKSSINECYCKQLSAMIFTVVNGLFSNNTVYPFTYSASTISINNIKSFNLISSQVLSNMGSAIHARESQISLEGDVVIAENIAYIGGALHMDCYHSLITAYKNCQIAEHTVSGLNLKSNSSIVFRNNTALNFGGCIALNGQCGLQSSDRTTSRIKPCFFNISHTSDYSLQDIHLNLKGNRALIAGNVLYGGPLETCAYIQNSQVDSIKIFSSIFNLREQHLSTIDVVSDPVRVCFCIQNITEGPYCLTELGITVYKGQEFTVSAIAVTPLLDSSSIFIKAELHTNNSVGQLGLFQKAQEVNRSCENLMYSIKTSEEHAELHLTLIRYPQSQTSIIYIHFLDCPLGFELTEELPKCDCAKHLTSAVPQITCDINSYSVHLPDNAWVGSFLGGIVAQLNCPYDYCNASNRLVALDNQNVQCSHRHSGVLCGSCQPGLSLALGSSHCLQCSNIYLILLLPFAVAGLLLVLVLQKCDLNVSRGTINGLIFYANIIQANKNIFFPQNSRLWLTNILATFVAWINLDLGIETCFANGLNAIARVWLQFAFPAYVWIIVGAMIYTSRYSVTISKLTGSNAVPVLATLFLLSYTKLLRAVIAAVSPIAITDRNATSHLLWATDGNVAFLHGAHIPLFLMAVVMTAVYVVPLTTVVTLAPYLQANSQRKLLRWVMRIKPLLDAYTGPYVDEHRYWTGLMLLTRIVLFIVFSSNSTGDPKLNLLVINGVLSGVLVLQRYAGILYKSSINRALEVLYLLNLLFLSAITQFLRGHHSAPLAQEITVCTMVGVSFLLFIFTVCWHIYNYNVIPSQVRQRVVRIFPKFTEQPPQPQSAEDTVGGAGGTPVQGTQAQPTVSVIDLSELREPLGLLNHS